MKTTVGLTHDPRRQCAWAVYWFGEPDLETSKQRKYTKSFRYKAEARTFQSEKQSEFDTGGARDRARNVTFAELLEQFTETRVAPLSLSSRLGYQNTIAQLREHFGNDVAVRDIDRRRAEKFMATRKRLSGKEKPLASWTRSRHLMHCRAVFNAGVEWGYIPSSPFAAPRRRSGSPLRVKGKSRPWQHIKPDEFVSLLVEVASVQKKAGLWLMYGCGLRAGEVYNLTVDKIDLKRRRVHIENREATDDVPPFTIKSDGQSSEAKQRTVPIPEAAIAALTEACGQAFKAGGFVTLTQERFQRVRDHWRLCREGKPWGAQSTHRPWQNRDMVNSFLRDTKASFRRSTVELTAPLTLHTFRKSFAQNHADHGTPPKTLSKLLGHSDVSMTMEFYNRVTDANEAEAGRTVDRLFDRAKAVRHAG